MVQVFVQVDYQHQQTDDAARRHQLEGADARVLVEEVLHRKQVNRLEAHRGHEPQRPAEGSLAPLFQHVLRLG